MPTITLPDGTQKQFDHPVTVMQVAEEIGAGLARATLGARVANGLVDAQHMIADDTNLQIITERDEESLEIIRHSCAHLMAQAVKQLFPNVQVTIGPVIEDGFYYDFFYAESFTPEDLQKIEDKMYELAKADFQVSRTVLSRNKAIQLFADAGETYKVEIINAIPEDQELSLYSQGDFIDLCRGPHVSSTAKLKAFKLTKLAGAYWRGDSKNVMLQRIYGTAWHDKKALKAYLYRLEEAEKRDHRKLGKKLGLFHFQPESPGMVFWHAKGWQIFQLLEQYIRGKLTEFGYQEVHTPQILDRKLWEKSGHLDRFSDDMFVTSSENRDYVIKPMNCPAHIQLFNQTLKSYRDLPLRMSEFGVVHRNEASGTLHGLMRARRFTQDDAHIFCMEEQLQEEVMTLIDLTLAIYSDFGFEQVSLAISTRPEQRVGTDAQWDISESALMLAVNKKGLDWKLQPGEGAFYGPKIEFILKDSLARKWQCGTIQVDLAMPGRLDASYVATDGTKKVPIMIHRAILGSIERFVGILIEHYAGSFPAWLAPIQVVVISLTEKQATFASEIFASLKKHGIRTDIDLRNETIRLKIREHAMQHVPYLLIIGAREVEQNAVAVRARNGKDMGSMTLNAFIEHLAQDVACFRQNVMEE
ncbi:Threonyl-tRNA synthetase [uncultured Candidatus Thioglobus sp.]|nr:Threonyl-tRNA synthetase [uncultured Candidatus Thioglobus sp.]